MWYYREREALAGGTRYTEAIFTNGTELFAANDELERDDRELLRVNEKLQRMYARAEDRVREREYLAFKMKIHDDIGQSLSVLRQTLQSGASAEKTERQVKKLSLAAGTLVYSPGAGSGDPYMTRCWLRQRSWAWRSNWTECCPSSRRSTPLRCGPFGSA